MRTQLQAWVPFGCKCATRAVMCSSMPQCRVARPLERGGSTVQCPAHNDGTRVQQQREAASGGERKRMKSWCSGSGSGKQY